MPKVRAEIAAKGPAKVTGGFRRVSKIYAPERRSKSRNPASCPNCNKAAAPVTAAIHGRQIGRATALLAGHAQIWCNPPPRSTTEAGQDRLPDTSDPLAERSSPMKQDANPRSRGGMRPSFANSSAQKERGRRRPPRERAQGARCTRGLLCKDAHKKTHTSIQVQRRQSGLPCAMVLRLIS
jgi:hypothetical protein